MKKLLPLILIFTCSLCKAQNLVPNPSFEDTVSCPHFANEMDKCANWHVSGGSPDYYHECGGQTGTQGVPNNVAGFQYAHTGVAYAGAILFYTAAPPGYIYRERFTCQLLSPLTIGIKYSLKMYVSWAGTFSKRIACNKIGMLFSTVDYNLSSPSPVANYCQFYSDSIVTDSLNWVLLSGSFIADSNYTHLTIGAFFDDAHTDTLMISPSSMAYYYIDDIYVGKDTTTAIIESNNDNELLIYPNPFNKELHIKTINAGLIKTELLDMNSNPIKNIETALKDGELIFYLDNLKQGIYFLRLTTNKNSKYYKLLKI